MSDLTHLGFLTSFRDLEFFAKGLASLMGCVKIRKKFTNFALSEIGNGKNSHQLTSVIGWSWEVGFDPHPLVPLVD